MKRKLMYAMVWIVGLIVLLGAPCFAKAHTAGSRTDSLSAGVSQHTNVFDGRNDVVLTSSERTL
jgi:hypothetical protein